MGDGKGKGMCALWVGGMVIADGKWTVTGLGMLCDVYVCLYT
jgi:hypothetical protein